MHSTNVKLCVVFRYMFIGVFYSCSENVVFEQQASGNGQLREEDDARKSLVFSKVIVR